MAAMLFDSIHSKLLSSCRMKSRIFPGHQAGSVCGAGLSASRFDQSLREAF